MTIINEIETERAAQMVKWGNVQDDAWSLGEWAALISHYSTRSVVGDLGAINIKAFRSDMVKVGALAFACIEAIDRK